MRDKLAKRSMHFLLLTVLIWLVGFSNTALAFSLFSPTVEKGEAGVEMHYANVVAGEEQEKGNQSLEAALEWSFLDSWRTEVTAEYFKPKDMNMELQSLEVELVRALTVQENGKGISSAVVIGGGFPKENTLAKTLELGFYLQRGFGVKEADGDEPAYDSCVLFNLYFRSQYGANAESGVEFEYAAQYKWNVSAVALGVEMYGEMGNLSDMPGFDQQEHYVGPVVFGEVGLGQGAGLGYEFGYLLGATKASADGVLKLNVAVDF